MFQVTQLVINKLGALLEACYFITLELSSSWFDLNSIPIFLQLSISNEKSLHESVVRRSKSFENLAIKFQTSLLSSYIMAATANNVFRLADGKVRKVAAEGTISLKPNEVLLKITHSGLCSSDTFYIPSGMALGHEGVGIVEDIGSAVTEFKVGDRAGGGYFRNASHYPTTLRDSVP